MLIQSPRLWLAAILVIVLAGTSTMAKRRAAADMAAAANRFLESLSPELLSRASNEFESDQRFRWHFIPPEDAGRRGLTIKAMSPDQRALVHDLLKVGLSASGYLTATQVMELEEVVRALRKTPGDFRYARDREQYYFSVFGTPSPSGTWGWRFEGHHLSLNFTVVNGTLTASAPTFFGANPAEVREGELKGRRVLAEEEDAARALVMSLDASQRRDCIFAGEAPNELISFNTMTANPFSPSGLPASRMTPAQREMLKRVIDAYILKMTGEIAALRMKRIRDAGVDTITFAWAGKLERGQQHYYRVQGPTFLIEYDSYQNSGNHIHSVWRDFDGDFGRDLLREHLATVSH